MASNNPNDHNAEGADFGNAGAGDRDPNDKERQMLAALRGRSYEVGYGKPPVHTRFKKGQSGNPKGRPKGRRNRSVSVTENLLHRIIQAEASREVTIAKGGRQLSVSMVEAIVARLANDAASGDPRARKLFMELLQTSEATRVRQQEELLETAIIYKHKCQQEIDHWRRFGGPEPEFLPHPDHVHIDNATGEVTFTGPVTPEQKKVWDKFADRKAAFLEEVAWLRWRLEIDADPLFRKFYEDELAHGESMLGILNRLLDGSDDEEIIAQLMAEYRADPNRFEDGPM